jgi:hypothetical protein
MAEPTSDVRFDKIDTHLEKISIALIKGFDRIDKTLETKADAADLQKALGFLDSIAKRQEISDD